MDSFVPHRTVVFFRETPWDSPIRVSTNSIAREFARDGWKVAWLLDPIFPLDLRPTDNQGLRAKVRLWLSGGRWSAEGVFEYCPMCLVRAGSYWPLNSVTVACSSLRLAIPPICRTLRQHGFWPVDVLVIGSRSSASACRAIPARYVLYHAHDFFADRTGPGELPPQVEAELIRRADFVLPAQELHRDKIIKYFSAPPDKVVVVPFASNPELFDSRPAEAPDLARIPRPRVALLGTTATMDLELLLQLARRRPEVHFVHIGRRDPLWEDEISRRGLSNVHLLGPRAFEELPGYLPYCDVGLAIYRVAQIGTRIVGGFYMKIYDYAAARLPIVVTEMPGYEGVRDFMFTAKTVEEFSAAIDKALAYTPQQRAMLERFSRQSGSWRARYEQILALLAHKDGRSQRAGGASDDPRREQLYRARTAL